MAPYGKSIFDLDKFPLFVPNYFDIPLATKTPLAPATRTFYVVKRSSTFRYLGTETGRMPWQETVKTAFRFVSVAAAAVGVAGAKVEGNYDLQIVRVTETLGKTETQLVSKTQIDATKPVVFFHLPSGQYGGKPLSDSTWNGVRDLQQAHVYSDLAAALEVLNRGSRTKGEYGIPVRDVAITHVHQVKIVNTPSTFTETVLS